MAGDGAGLPDGADRGADEESPLAAGLRDNFHLQGLMDDPARLHSTGRPWQRQRGTRWRLGTFNANAWTTLRANLQHDELATLDALVVQEAKLDAEAALQAEAALRP